MNEFRPSLNDLIELFRQTLRDLSNVTRAIAMHPDFTNETAQSIAEAMTQDNIEGVTITPIIDDAPRPLSDDIKICQNCNAEECGAGAKICIPCAYNIYKNNDETVMFWDDACFLYAMNHIGDDDFDDDDFDDDDFDDDEFEPFDPNNQSPPDNMGEIPW